MTKLIIHVNPTESGLEEKKAKEIESLFLPMVKRLNEMEKAFNEVVSKEKTPENAAIARLLRLQIAAERVLAEKAKTAGKAEYLRAGNAIQGVYNLYLYASKSKEEKLLEIEKFAEVQEKERIENLKIERSTILFELGVTEDDIQHIQLGKMMPEVWDNYLIGQKASFKAKKEAEKQAELDRIEAEKRIKLHEERKLLLLPIWEFVPSVNHNDDFGALTDAEWDDRYKYSLNKKEQAQKEQEAKDAEILRLKKESDLKDKEAEKLKKIQDAKIEAEAEKAKLAQDKLDRIERAKVMEEARRVDDLQNELKKGDSDKVKDLITDLTALKTKYVFKSKKFKHIYSQVGMLIDKVTDHINK